MEELRNYFAAIKSHQHSFLPVPHQPQAHICILVGTEKRGVLQGDLNGLWIKRPCFKGRARLPFGTSVWSASFEPPQSSPGFLLSCFADMRCSGQACWKTAPAWGEPLLGLLWCCHVARALHSLAGNGELWFCSLACAVLANDVPLRFLFSTTESQQLSLHCVN